MSIPCPDPRVTCMVTASSVGAYFNANIRDHYRYRRSAALTEYNRPLSRRR